jgi:two-component system, LytTR family, sensor kinase
MKSDKRIPRYQNFREQNDPVEKTIMNRKKVYWISQFTGWTTFILVNIIIIASIESITTTRILIWVLLGVLGILFTHLLRKVIKKQNWLSLPLKQIIPRVLLSSFIIGIIIYGFVFTAGYFGGTFKQEEITLTRAVSGILNLTSVTLFWSLIYFSVHYFENYKKKEIESLIWEAAVKDYELKTLKSQLNPHFMFNAMNSIRALIEEDREAAKSALTKLSNILRYSLQMERMEKVPLEDEIETVKNYLDLEKVRFEERLRYSIDINSGSAKVEIPPMMVQTLVENAIKHGISKRTRGGEIHIKSKVESTVEGSKLKIEIRNSGHLSEEELKNSSGFGLNNTKHRLHLLFGDNAQFLICNDGEDKVLAQIEIPTGTGSAGPEQTGGK